LQSPPEVPRLQSLILYAEILNECGPSLEFSSFFLELLKRLNFLFTSGGSGGGNSDLAVTPRGALQSPPEVVPEVTSPPVTGPSVVADVADVVVSDVPVPDPTPAPAPSAPAPKSSAADIAAPPDLASQPPPEVPAPVPVRRNPQRLRTKLRVF
jgi:hypothetical protein